MTDFYFVINYLACHPGNFVAVKSPPLRYSQPKLSGIYSARQRQQLYALQIPAQGTAGMTGFLLYYQVSRLSSWKFRGGEITTLIRPAEIIRDLQRVQMLATLREVDCRSRDCGNDGFLLCDQLSSLSS
jgi:hypothetical protein